ncbi:thylakoid membrane protein TERC, chloroplastic isoform X1 [Selaginella moellendorffii]|nr:thylakoid membrane protein TERC, chloroplastic isoform X1 [Selaginella moellendorffii]|eukprot:XP_024515016.1 thylakoid membrane protein TERC, chloroplastic isoform X1 [Selaginella moellendorffii]
MAPGFCASLSSPSAPATIRHWRREILTAPTIPGNAAPSLRRNANTPLVLYATRLSTLRTLLHCMPKDTQDDHNESTEQSIGIVAEKLVEAAAISVSTVGEIEIEDVPVTKPVIEKEAAIKTVVFWVTAAAAFGAFVGVTEGSTKASEFFAGYLLEQSLSVDNLFVFVLIFNYFQVPLQYQSRVLTYGIAGAIVFRATMILLGVATLERFEVVNLLLAAILLFSSYKLLTGSDEENDFSENYIVNTCKRFIPVTPDYDGQKFFTTIDGVRMATPLLLTLAVIELSDIAFAVDSIPAVFGVTRDPFIVFSSNLFAILGLRSLYTLISSSMAELEYLQPAVAAILGFIGAKMVLDFFGLHVPTEVSLGIVATTLGAGVSLSLLRPHDDEQND